MKYQDIERYYEEVRRKHQARRNYYLEKANEDAEFKELNKQKTALSLRLYRAQFEENEPLVSSLSEELSVLSQKIALRLTALGMEERDVLPSYDCPLCKDTGYVMEKPCSCFEKARKILLKKEGVSKDFLPFYEEENIPSPHLKQIANSVRAYAQKFPQTELKTLVFTGQTGTGKTRLMQAYVKTAEEKGYSVLYFTASELASEFLNYHTGKLSERGNLMDRLLSCDLLAIDDLGTEPMLKNVTKEYLFSVLSTRALRGKHTVITTNLSPNEVLGRYEERIFSRLSEKGKAKWISFQGIPDLRLN
ncbi:MAG: ATP-binding protein [Clostridia bacterium]|nr:ATP-binding protein [Clostridia bacterium]